MLSRLIVPAVLLIALLFAAPILSQQPSADRVTLEKQEGRVRISIGADLFTEYRFADTPKPVLYPIVGPHGINMTRHYPMKRVEGEADDHPHHRSLWFGHGAVNGIDFWAEAPRSGRVVHDKLVEAVNDDDGTAHLTVRNKWIDADDNIICTDTRTLRFAAKADVRTIDYRITLHASNGPVTLGDTKEGTMAIRTHPALRLRNDPKRGVTTANGQAVNSEGDHDDDLWGKRAKWVDYVGEIEGHQVGIAIFDHPDNPRHPTWWHARNYGLVAANPFGIHDFEKKPAGTGDMTIAAGESVTFHYRFVFHAGDAEAADIDNLYAEFTQSK